jgi:hypothetical protein
MSVHIGVKIYTRPLKSWLMGHHMKYKTANMMKPTSAMAVLARRREEGPIERYWSRSNHGDVFGRIASSRILMVLMKLMRCGRRATRP